MEEGSTMRRIYIYRLAAAFLLCIGMASAQTCPAFVKKTAAIGNLSGLSFSGKVFAARFRGYGIYSSTLGQNNPTLVPNTSGDPNCNSLQVSDNGLWFIYNCGGVYVIGADGLHKTKVPVTASGSEGCCTIWWKCPQGDTEIVYRASGDKIVHAIPIHWGANGPTFGTDRTIAQFNEVMEFTMGVSGNHMWTRVDDAHNGPKFITLPGSGSATDASFWTPTTFPSYGCMCTITRDGSLCVFNAGYDQWCTCLADEFCLLRHKSFVVLPFQLNTAPSIRWDTLLHRATSINWTPAQYVMSDTNNLGSDAKGWNFTSDSTYLAGDLYGNKVGADSGTIWLVHWPSNTWTKILSLNGGCLAFSSVWINKTNAIAPRSGIHALNRAVPSKGAAMVDIRGRIVSNGGMSPKLIPGVYYTVSQGGVMKRIVIGR
jgi:hypothetical protein